MVQICLNYEEKIRKNVVIYKEIAKTSFQSRIVNFISLRPITGTAVLPF